MPHSKLRGAILGLYQLHYHDELIRDMDLEPHQLGCCCEYVCPYTPDVYARLVGSQREDGFSPKQSTN